MSEREIAKKNGKLRATFRHNIKNHKAIYHKSTAILLISVGQGYHEGEKFESTIALINRARFKKCLIMVSDSIQRHNLCIDKCNNLQEAHQLANKLGEEWLQRNECYLQNLKVPYETIRWDTWIKHADYQKHRDKLDFLYEQEESFRRGFLNSIDQFINRYKKNSNINIADFDNQKACSLCLEYLKEECAIIMPLWAQDLYNFIIYPSSMLEAMEVTHKKLVEPFCSNVLYWLSLRFKRRENL